MSLEEIAEKTKIGIRLLRAIESEQFDKLPGGLFNKSFVRQYARLLGVDEDVAIREYLQAFGARQEGAAAARGRLPDPPSFATEAEYSRLILAVLGMGILMAGIAYGGYRLYGYLAAAPALPASLPDAGFTPSPAPASEESLAASEDGYEPAAAGDGVLDRGEEAPGGDALIPGIPPGEPAVGSEAASAPVSLPPEELALRIDSHGTVWLSITADGVRQWQGTMRENQSREVQAAESVRLTVGDAGAVSLTLNGKSLPGLGRPGEVRNLTITAREAAETSP
jgi:cytoskeleton protein RodZ